MAQFYVLSTIYAFIFMITVVSGDSAFRFPSRKAWWAKQVTDDVYTAGRLTQNQFKMAAEAGFKSVISMFNHTTHSYLGDEIFPTTDESRDIITHLAGIEFGVVIPGGYRWKTLDTVHRFGVLYGSLPKPILFHCVSAYSVTYTTLLHFANVSRHSPDAKPKIDKRELYRRAAVLGYDFTTRPTLKEMIVSITGEDDIRVPPIQPDVSLPNWNKNSWLVKPVYKNWYVAGAIQSNHMSKLNRSGFDVIINNRKGAPQEEVVLLNIRDRTGTNRQAEDRLLKNRIDPNKPNEYISLTSQVNYQSRNPLQFGDDIGYNENMERDDIQENWPFEYIHSPIGGEYGYNMAMWQEYRDQWLVLGKNKHVLVHCRTGYRAVVAALLSAGYMYCKSSDWALERARGMGYHFKAGTEDNIIRLFKAVLDSNPSVCHVIDPESAQPITGSANQSDRSLTLLTILSVWLFIAFV